MATLTTAQQSLLQDAIDLMVKGSAREIPFAEDVVERLSKFIKGVTGDDLSGLIYEGARDNPFTMLIAIVADVGFPVLTEAEEDQLYEAAQLMALGTAYETPFADDVIERLAPVAESSGFLTKGGFKEAIRDRPISTMLQWALALGD